MEFLRPKYTIISAREVEIFVFYCHSHAPEQSDKCPWGESGNPVAKNTTEPLDPRFRGDDKLIKHYDSKTKPPAHPSVFLFNFCLRYECCLFAFTKRASTPPSPSPF
ncbi:MAG: hypothetical protein A2538_01155 [Candidatus Magasanikbacteria bacterium RIFOXYD2_FULL_41_14]|uniref:Uncharacterized protein n=1 Tax=Candidatus Magasanikbacteria bacterium RIFOXYD2_FULL_41_14 TaxID=1798709 RepID=A0A1F6PE02_9BACT|nr:MAG: hypothetical protein A2538_01155 [Candidatus Magasanikbacteria bacterium RIFOXYD2_FULL_41_14]